MEYKEILKNISGTVCVLGLAVSSMNVNSTLLVSGNGGVSNMNQGYYAEAPMVSMPTSVSNIYIQHDTRKLEMEAEELFGVMRDATLEEQGNISNYIKSISKDTGVNFFDLC